MLRCGRLRGGRSLSVPQSFSNDGSGISNIAESSTVDDCSSYLATHSPFAMRFRESESDLKRYMNCKIDFDNKPIYNINGCGTNGSSSNERCTAAPGVHCDPRRVTVIARISSWKKLLTDGLWAGYANMTVESIIILADDALKQLFNFYKPTACESDISGMSDEIVTVRPLIAVNLNELRTIQEDFPTFPRVIRYLLVSRRSFVIQCSSLSETREACAWLAEKFYNAPTAPTGSRKSRWQYMFELTIVELPIDCRVAISDIQQFWLDVWMPLREQATLREVGETDDDAGTAPTELATGARNKPRLKINLNLALDLGALDFSRVLASQLDVLFAGEFAKFIRLPVALFDEGCSQRSFSADSAWASLMRLQGAMRHPKRYLLFDVPSNLTSREPAEKACFINSMQQTQSTILRIAIKKSSSFASHNGSKNGKATQTFLDVNLTIGTHHNRIQYPLLLPAVNVTESNYISWEFDMTKYIAYRDAMYEAIKKRSAESDALTAFVVGPGRGRFIFYLIDACQRLHISPTNVAIYAVEKNPNAIKAMLKKFRGMQPMSRRYGSSTIKIDSLAQASLYKPQSILRGYYSVEETGVHEFSVTESAHNGYYVELLCGDYRNWTGPLSSSNNSVQADIVVSELLGAVGCNELAPECLATQRAPGAGRNLIIKPDAVFIPKSFTSFIMPIMSADLQRNLLRLDPHLLSRDDPYLSMQLARGKSKRVTISAHEYGLREAPQSVWETCFGVFLPLAEPQQLFHFDFPDKGELRFEREANLMFTVNSTGGQVHGFLAYFKAAIDDQHEISLSPFDGKCKSWGQIFFPGRDESKSVVARGDELCLGISRKVDDEYVWYEWQIRHGNAQTMNNADGACFSIPLYGQPTENKRATPRLQRDKTGAKFENP